MYGIVLMISTYNLKPEHVKTAPERPFFFIFIMAKLIYCYALFRALPNIVPQEPMVCLQ